MRQSAKGNQLREQSRVAVANNWVYGFHAVSQVLKRAVPGTLYLRQGQVSERAESMIKLAGYPDCVIERWEAAAFKDALGETASHQGVAFLSRQAPIVPQQTLDDVLSPSAGHKIILVLDGVTDPGNLGACLRSAATFGVDAVVVPKHGSAPLNAAVFKRSAGAASHVPVIEVVNLARAFKQMKANGLWVIGTALGAGQALHEVDLAGDVALVMGSEGGGLRVNTRKHCDLLVEIPMAISAFNLNVSVATGVCLYEAFRQRGSQSPN